MLSVARKVCKQKPDAIYSHESTLFIPFHFNRDRRNRLGLIVAAAFFASYL